MNADQISTRPTGMVIDGSPLPFAIMGPAGSHRRTIIRSDGDVLDLVGMDNQGLGPEEDRGARIPSLLLFVGGKPPLRRFIVHSARAHDIDASQRDNRKSYLSFAWRGLASPSDVDKVAHAFDRISVDLNRSLKRHDLDGIEWQIAPLISLCQDATERQIGRMSSKFMIIGLLTILYVTAIAVAVAKVPWPW